MANKFKPGDIVYFKYDSGSNFDWSGIPLVVDYIAADVYVVKPARFPTGWNTDPTRPPIGDYEWNLTSIRSESFPPKSQSTALKHDDSLTQPLRNDGERCIYCNRPTVELVLVTSVTRWCPPCETNGTLVNKVVDKRTQPALSSSELDFDEWLAEASKILKIP